MRSMKVFRPNAMNSLDTRKRRVVGMGAALILVTIALGMFSYTWLRVIRQTASRIANDTMPCLYLIGQLQNTAFQRLACS